MSIAIIQHKGVTILDACEFPMDTEASKQVLELLKNCDCNRRYALWADIEGHEDPDYIAVGTLMRDAGLNRLITYGSACKRLAITAAAKAVPCVHLEKPADVVLTLKKILSPGDALLVRGSDKEQLLDILRQVRE